MKAFGEYVVNCPKCQTFMGPTTATVFRAAEPALWYGNVEAKPERLVLSCRSCGWEYWMRPADAPLPSEAIPA